MIAALLITFGWLTLVLLLVLAFARAGVVRVSVTRPARPRNNGSGHAS